MKNVFLTFLILIAGCVGISIESCNKQPEQKELVESVNYDFDSLYVAQPSTVFDFASNISVDVWESKLTKEQFNGICSMYTGRLSAYELYKLSCGYSNRDLTGLTPCNTILKQGTRKKIYSNPSITEYLLAHIGQSQNVNASMNFYSIGTSATKITWQDATNSAFAENLAEITDFNPDLIDWENSPFLSGCNFMVDYPYPLYVWNGTTAVEVSNNVGTVFIKATCENENVIDGVPNLPLSDYYVEIPVLGGQNLLYFQN